MVLEMEETYYSNFPSHEQNLHPFSSPKDFSGVKISSRGNSSDHKNVNQKDSGWQRIKKYSGEIGATLGTIISTPLVLIKSVEVIDYLSKYRIDSEGFNKLDWLTRELMKLASPNTPPGSYTLALVALIALGTAVGYVGGKIVGYGIDRYGKK